ncbi:Hypothetical predicted protein, partial [Marmota monax]
SINDAEKRGKCKLLIRECSKAIVWFLTMRRKHSHIGKFKITDDHKAGKTAVNLT